METDARLARRALALEGLAAAGVIELLDDDDVTWCERRGAATDRVACGCMRSVKRVG